VPCAHQIDDDDGSLGHVRRIEDVSDMSGVPRIASELAPCRIDVVGQRTKSLRSSPLRGGKSREALNQPKGRQ
jgi:hypothetical protein